jgi:RNA polymerase sigma factor (sigma-70 family)
VQSEDFEQLREQMLRRARAIVKNRDDAEDVVQTAFERAWRSGAGMCDGFPRVLLLKITSNAAIDLLRARRTVAIPEDLADAVAGPEERVLMRERLDELQEMLRRLRPPQRRTFVLHEIAGYSSREIAARDGLPYPTVKTHLRRARLALRAA